MTPIEVMAKAYDEEFPKWEMTVLADEWEITRAAKSVFRSTEDEADFDKFDELRKQASHRAALLALAECESTPKMAHAVCRKRKTEGLYLPEMLSIAKAWVEAAAAEGEGNA